MRSAGVELASVVRLVRQFIGNIVKNLSMDDPCVLQILDPWSLMYGEYEDDFIEVLRQRIGPKHPLYNRKVYAVAIRRDPEATLFHAYNDGFYAIVYFSAVPRGRPGMPNPTFPPFRFWQLGSGAIPPFCKRTADLWC